MTKMALELDEEEPIICISESLNSSSFRMLLENGDILYQDEKYERFIMEEETPVFISDWFVLTDGGNVYYLDTASDGISGIVKADLQCIYSGGDIIAINAMAARCLGLLENGSVISLGGNNPLDVTGWKDIIAIEQGFNYAVGLTDKGKVLYVDYSTSSTEAAYS